MSLIQRKILENLESFQTESVNGVDFIDVDNPENYFLNKELKVSPRTLKSMQKKGLIDLVIVNVYVKKLKVYNFGRNYESTARWESNYLFKKGSGKLWVIEGNELLGVSPDFSEITCGNIQVYQHN